jgi:predicted lactoylglutathione lyase
MNGKSAVGFATEKRVHISLPVSDLGASTAFYKFLLGAEPDKIRNDYARFSSIEPPLNLSLMPGSGAGDFRGHFGIQVKSSDEVNAMIERLRKAGVVVSAESQQSCCYAVQDKLWISDPDGNSWEVFVNTNDEAERDEPKGETCCAGSTCC